MYSFSFARNTSLTLCPLCFSRFFYPCVRVNSVPDSADDLYLNSRPMQRDQFLPLDDAPLLVDGRVPKRIISPGVNRTVGVALISVHRAREDSPRPIAHVGYRIIRCLRSSFTVVVFSETGFCCCRGRRLARTEVTRWFTATRYRSKSR